LSYASAEKNVPVKKATYYLGDSLGCQYKN